MKREPQTLKMKFDAQQWETADRYFRSYTHVDVSAVPEKFKDYVLPMKEVMKGHARVLMKYGIAEVTRREEERIVLEEDQVFAGRMIGKAYKDAEQVVIFVASVVNIDELLETHRDMMDTFFLEYWAVAMLSACREYLEEQLQIQLNGSGKKLTTVWSPGQSKFELCNQKPLFHLLRPETIGVRLDRNMRMLPLKSISGTVGVVAEEVKIEMISCDYCEHAKTCPGYKGVRYRDFDKQRRLV